ncbi:Dimer-Tnp-hAT domain containing protein [Pyrenophora tritici-repentis]|nr:Dimer-Tnp-hAT domain containing protein [Pyrenophora tritici-repentis]
MAYETVQDVRARKLLKEYDAKKSSKPPIKTLKQRNSHKKTGKAYGAEEPFSLSPPPPPLSPRQALVAAPQAPNFEATLRESRAEETIIPPPKGSEHATVAALGAASEAVDEDDKGGKRGYLGIVAYYVDSSGELRDLPIALLQLTGAHTSEAMAKVVIAIFKQFEITVGKLGYFVLNNAHNNNTTINTLALQIGFSATKQSPKDHLAINLRAALVKAREYYNKLDLSLAYYAATILYPRYKSYLNAAKFAIDMLSIPGSSCECERLFSELGDLLEPRRHSISPQLLAAIQCDRRWIRAGFGTGEVPVKEAISDEEMDAKYGVHKWDIS